MKRAAAARIKAAPLPHRARPWLVGRLAGTPSGVAALALRAGAPVVPLFIARRASGGHAIRVPPPFPPADRSRDAVEGLTAAYTAAIEAQVRAHPTEWVWWHRRWRRQPAPSSVISPIS